jgi:hypothetical protein
MRLTRHPARFPLALIGLTLAALVTSFSLAAPVLAAINGAAVTGSINDDNPEDRRQFQAMANDVITIITRAPAARTASQAEVIISR